MKDKSTSDEKLLKLIEGASAAKPAQKVGLRLKGKGFPRFPLKFNLRPPVNLPNINKGLFGACGLLTLLFFFTIITGANAIRADLIFPSSKINAAAKGIAQQGGNFLSPQEYQNEISKRNIFIASDIRAKGEKELPPELSQLMQDLKLVGVIWSKNPEAMIESAKENRTYLLKKGDTFSQQQLKIKEVTRSSVIFEIEAGGQTKEYELR
jgi:hypothetical protein